MYLSNLPIFGKGIVGEIKANGFVKTRLLDLGFILGTKVEVALVNYAGTLKAYLVKGAVIALRDVDAKKILLKEVLCK